MKMFTEQLDDLSIDEKIALVSGTDFMYTNPVPIKKRFNYYFKYNRRKR